MKILIIEDEINCVEALSAMLRSCSNEITALENVASVDEALKKLENFHPNLVFIDVQLGEQTCFDLLDQLGKVDFQLVFTTAYDNYAIKAFEYSALHYLLKPMLLSDIKEALARYTKNHTTTSTIQSSIEKAKNLYLKTTLKIMTLRRMKFYISKRMEVILRFIWKIKALFLFQKFSRFA